MRIDTAVCLEHQSVRPPAATVSKLVGTLGLVVVLSLPARPAAADAVQTLVQKSGTTYKPGLAKSWTVKDGIITFVLTDGVDGARAAQMVTEHINGAQGIFADGVLRVRGVPVSTVLDQASVLNIVSEDPLGELGALQGAVATASTVEGGGSIRAARPAEFAVAGDAAAPLANPSAVNRNEMLEAEVLAVKRGAFPHVVLRLRVRRPAAGGPLAKELHKGRVIEGTVLFVGNPFDLQNEDNRRNLAGFYLAAGDKVIVHAQVGAAGQFDQVGVDWLERY